MDTYDKNLNACLLHRNKQLTRQLKDYQQTLAPNGLFFFFNVGDGAVVETSSAPILWMLVTGEKGRMVPPPICVEG